MKKYLLVFMALVAGIALSAFSSLEDQAGKKSSVDDPYFWYQVNALQTQTVGTTINPSQRELKSVYATGDCLDDSGMPICLVGFHDEVSPGTSVPSDPAQIIRETDD